MRTLKTQYPEEDLLPLSALQHLVFCERQCALIHIEQQWSENMLTAQGRILHQKAHREKHESRDGVRTEFGMPVRSFLLGLIGKTDVVEFHHSNGSASSPTIPVPVEYKRGRPKTNDCDRVQLCAQALCLEEMLGCTVPIGAIFYGKTRRRLDVSFDVTLRNTTARYARCLHELISTGKTPPAKYSRKCDRCSLLELCLPKMAGLEKSASAYLADMAEMP